MAVANLTLLRLWKAAMGDSASDLLPHDIPLLLDLPQQ